MQRRYMHYKFYVPKRTYIEDIDRPKVFISRVKPRTRRPGGEVGRLFNQHIWSDAKYGERGGVR